MKNRQQIIALAKQAGFPSLRIEELGTCDARRAAEICSGQIDAVTPGTLTLSDPAAAFEAWSLCEEELIGVMDRDND